MKGGVTTVYYEVLEKQVRFSFVGTENMTKILLVGASGQLGSVILTHLLNDGRECRILLRPSSKFVPPDSNNIDVVEGDLADYTSLKKSCLGIDVVIATASAIVPRAGEKFGEDEIENYRRLVDACTENAVKQFVFVSAFSSAHDELVPEFLVKRKIEQLIIQSGIAYTIFRCAAFMDIYYAAIGSSLATYGVQQPTLLRGFWLTKIYAKLTQGLIEKYRIALLPGNGKTKHAFICVDDVARFIVKSINIPTAKNRVIDLAGREVLSWNEVVKCYEELLGKKIVRVIIPAAMLNLIRLVLHPFSKAGENIISVLYVLGRYDYYQDMLELSSEFSLPLRTTHEFLQEKYKMSKNKEK